MNSEKEYHEILHKEYVGTVVRNLYVSSRGATNKKAKRKLPESVKQQIIKLAKQGISIKRIAKQLNSADGSVRYYIKKAGLG